MALIFLGSTDVMSAHHTSRFLVPFLRWLFPRMSPELIATAQSLVRKGWHLTEYAVLALLVWNALVRPFALRPTSWPMRATRLAWLLCVLFAASDEFHQAFVPSRISSVSDVGLDAGGSAAALLALWTFGRWRAFW